MDICRGFIDKLVKENEWKQFIYVEYVYYDYYVDYQCLTWEEKLLK